MAQIDVKTEKVPPKAICHRGISYVDGVRWDADH